jgi:hypothetical protein
VTVVLSVYKAMNLPIGGGVLDRGSRSAPIQITVDGLHEELRKTLATATTWDVWSAGANVLADFDYLWIESDQDVSLELTCDVGGEVGTVVFAVIVKAGRPFDLLTDDAVALYTANFASGTTDVIDRLRIRNASGSTANIRVLLVT